MLSAERNSNSNQHSPDFIFLIPFCISWKKWLITRLRQGTYRMDFVPEARIDRDITNGHRSQLPYQNKLSL